MVADGGGQQGRNKKWYIGLSPKLERDGEIKREIEIEGVRSKARKKEGESVRNLKRERGDNA